MGCMCVDKEKPVTRTAAAVRNDETATTADDPRHLQMVAAVARAQRSYVITVLVPRLDDVSPADAARLARIPDYKPNSAKVVELWFAEVLVQPSGKGLFERTTQAVVDSLRSRLSADFIRQVAKLTTRALFEVLYPSAADTQFEEDVRTALADTEIVSWMASFESAALTINAWLDAARDAGQNDRFRRATELYLLRHNIESLDVDQAKDISRIRDALARARKARTSRPAGPRPTPRLLARLRT